MSARPSVAFADFERARKRLALFISIGRGATPTAEAEREKMNEFWAYLSVEEKKLAQERALADQIAQRAAERERHKKGHRPRFESGS